MHDGRAGLHRRSPRKFIAQATVGEFVIQNYDAAFAAGSERVDYMPSGLRLGDKNDVIGYVEPLEELAGHLGEIKRSDEVRLDSTGKKRAKGSLGGDDDGLVPEA